MSDDADTLPAAAGPRPGPGWTWRERAGGYWFPPVRPCRCPDCGHSGGRHPWACGVLVRLTARLLAWTDPPGWRERAAKIAARQPDPFGPCAEFFRDVAAEPDPPPPGAAPWVCLEPWPESGPAAGLCEVPDATRYNYPDAIPLLAAAPRLTAHLKAALGAVPLPVLFQTEDDAREV